MPGWLAQLSSFTVFLSIAGIGFFFLLVSLLFGEIFGHFEAHFDHDIGEHGGPGFFSTRILSVFVTAFGGFGAVATHYGLSTVPASGVGFASGIFFASLIYLFASFLYSQQATSEVHSADMIGQQARVIIAIPAGGVGQIRLRMGEDLVDKIARSRSNQAIAENATVKIEEILGEIVVVSPQ